MNEFDSAQAAKEFIIARIVAQAERDGSTLSDVERKMMFFSETGWTLPDIWEVSEVFDRDYDQTEYERKIGTIAKNTEAHLHKTDSGEKERWQRAISALQDQDHYLLVLLAVRSARDRVWIRDRAKLVLTALAVCLAIVVVILLTSR